MKLNKVYILFISLLFLTSMASKLQVDGVQASIQKDQSQHFHKAESADFGFMDFLFEEDTTENEEDNLFSPFTFSPFSSLFSKSAVELTLNSAFRQKKAFAFSYSPLYLIFRNIRL